MTYQQDNAENNPSKSSRHSNSSFSVEFSLSPLLDLKVSELVAELETDLRKPEKLAHLIQNNINALTFDIDGIQVALATRAIHDLFLQTEIKLSKNGLTNKTIDYLHQLNSYSAEVFKELVTSDRLNPEARLDLIEIAANLAREVLFKAMDRERPERGLEVCAELFANIRFLIESNLASSMPVKHNSAFWSVSSLVWDVVEIINEIEEADLREAPAILDEELEIQACAIASTCKDPDLTEILLTTFENYMLLASKPVDKNNPDAEIEMLPGTSNHALHYLMAFANCVNSDAFEPNNIHIDLDNINSMGPYLSVLGIFRCRPEASQPYIKKEIERALGNDPLATQGLIYLIDSKENVEIILDCFRQAGKEKTQNVLNILNSLKDNFLYEKSLDNSASKFFVFDPFINCSTSIANSEKNIYVKMRQQTVDALEELTFKIKTID